MIKEGLGFKSCFHKEQKEKNQKGDISSFKEINFEWVGGWCSDGWISSFPEYLNQSKSFKVKRVWLEWTHFWHHSLFLSLSWSSSFFIIHFLFCFSSFLSSITSFIYFLFCFLVCHHKNSMHYSIAFSVSIFTFLYLSWLLPFSVLSRLFLLIHHVCSRSLTNLWPWYFFLSLYLHSLFLLSLQISFVDAYNHHLKAHDISIDDSSIDWWGFIANSDKWWNRWNKRLDRNEASGSETFFFSSQEWKINHTWREIGSDFLLQKLLLRFYHPRQQKCGRLYGWEVAISVPSFSVAWVRF